MSSDDLAKTANTQFLGLFYALLGVVGFSLTLPATRIAVAHLHPDIVGLGRGVAASVCAAAFLGATRQPLPARRHWPALAAVALCVALGFPLLSAWAMTQLPANHGAVLLGILPLATAIAAALRAGERPSRGFWTVALAGSAGVLGFAVWSGAGTLQRADLLLVAAALVAALGYAEGGRLARDLGGWRVISWALVLAGPALTPPALWAVYKHGIIAPVESWLGFAYVALVSQWLGFFAWYKGLALAGVARAGQLQLLQTFFTLAAAAVWPGEQISIATIAFALWVVGAVALSRRMPIAIAHRTELQEKCAQ